MKIFVKQTSRDWKCARVNSIENPGHRDFAAEVELVFQMAVGALL